MAQAQTNAAMWRDPNELSSSVWAPALMGAVLLGFALVVLFGLRSQHTPPIAGLLLAVACLAVGVLLGFLFDVPRSSQSNGAIATDPATPATVNGDASAGTAPPKPRTYVPNTNLEQISDWLTKILVGVGLTQLNELPDRLTQMGAYFGPSMGATADGRSVAVAVVILFTVLGFLMGFLWTRLFLGGALVKSDRELDPDVRQRIDESVDNAVNAKREETHQQDQTDAAALSLVSQYLSDTDVTKLDVADLKRHIALASPPFKVQIFYKAREVRSAGWKDAGKRPLIARTVPIFEALVEADATDKRFPQNHAQLGYALKDQPVPDYARALDEFSTAIAMRGDAAEAGYSLYELNRAYCRIKLDPESTAQKPSLPAARTAIYADLKIGKQASETFWGNPDILNWIKLNGADDLLK